MARQYINIKNIASRLMRHPLLTDVTFESMVIDTIDFMRIVGVPDMFIDKVDYIEIKNYRGKLPCDFSEENHVKYNEKGVRYSTDNFHQEYELQKDNPQFKSPLSDVTFRIQNNFIYTSIKEGILTLSYKAIATDEDGYPLIPDNSNFLRALESYIKKQHFSILFDLGKITQAVYHKTEQEYAWNVGSCSTDMKRLTIPQAESFYNSFNTLIVRAEEYKYGFANLGTKEKIRRY